MINKEWIDVHKGVVSTCVVILNEDMDKLDSKIVVKSVIDYTELHTLIKELPKKEKPEYLVIKDIDKIDKNLQDRYYQIVKDREFHGYELPKDMLIVLTIENQEGLKKISNELYHLCIAEI